MVERVAGLPKPALLKDWQRCRVHGPKDGKSYVIPTDEFVSRLIVVPIGVGGTVFVGVGVFAHPIGLVWGARIWLIVCYPMADEEFRQLQKRLREYMTPQVIRDWEARRDVPRLKPTPRR